MDLFIHLIDSACSLCSKSPGEIDCSTTTYLVGTDVAGKAKLLHFSFGGLAFSVVYNAGFVWVGE